MQSELRYAHEEEETIAKGDGSTEREETGTKNEEREGMKITRHEVLRYQSARR